MPRAKTTVPGRARRRKVLKAAKGNIGGRRKLYKSALQTMQRAGRFRNRLCGDARKARSFSLELVGDKRDITESPSLDGQFEHGRMYMDTIGDDLYRCSRVRQECSWYAGCAMFQ